MKKNAGSTLIELVVCVAMFSVLCMAALGFLSYTVNMYTKTVVKTEQERTFNLINRVVDTVTKKGENIYMDTTEKNNYIASDIGEQNVFISYDAYEKSIAFISVSPDAVSQKVTVARNIENWNIQTKDNIIKIKFTINTKNNPQEYEITKMCDIAS